jgi:thiol-disulfide isomerase/thioredoxin
VITHTDNPLLLWYVVGWVGFCLMAGAILVRDRVRVRVDLRCYWVYLTMPWKLGILICYLFIQFRVFSGNEVLAPYKWEGKQDQALQDRLVVYYFGGSECPPCNSVEHTRAIIQVKERLPVAYPDLLFKSVPKKTLSALRR